jgi:hypothetical protein
MKKYTLILFLMLTAICVGCSNNVKVSGIVTFTDGEPVEVGTICFLRGGLQSRGELGAGGRYTVATLGADDGLPAGTYQVFFVGVENQYVNPKGGELVYELLIDEKYIKPDTSGITVEINSKNRVFDFELERFQRR